MWPTADMLYRFISSFAKSNKLLEEEFIVGKCKLTINIYWFIIMEGSISITLWPCVLYLLSLKYWMHYCYSIELSVLPLKDIWHRPTLCLGEGKDHIPNDGITLTIITRVSRLTQSICCPRGHGVLNGVFSLLCWNENTVSSF